MFQSNYSFTISPGESLVGIVTASSNDFTYELTEDNKNFKIDKTSGVITFNGPITKESKEYLFKVIYNIY